MSGRLLYFYPENDLALAVGLPGYTAPEPAARLRLSGEALPLWYGNNGDRVLMSGINAAWYDRMQQDFGITADVFDFDCSGLEAEPWGWSLPVRNIYVDQGFNPDSLPDNVAIERIRQLSNRCTSIVLSEKVCDALPFMCSSNAVAVHDIQHLEDELDRRGRVLIKQPWSSSGRGVIDSLNMAREDVLRQMAGIIRRQGCAIVENVLSRRADFAMLFRNTVEKMDYCGLSVFNTDHRFCYSGNVVANQTVLAKIINNYIEKEKILAMRDTLAKELRAIMGADYVGPLGVDLMVTDDGPAIAEVNLRNTMGHVCLALGERLIVPGQTASFSIVPALGEEPQYTAAHGRLTGGTLSLTPGRFFSFLLRTQK